MKNNRKKYVFKLLLVACVMTIGFAVLSTSISLGGETLFNANTWNVKLQNIVVDEESVSSTAPSITDNTSLSFSATLSSPGDYYAFTVDVVNAGSIDAMVDSISKTTLTTKQKKLIAYDVFYENGSDILKYDKLSKTNGTAKIIVLVEYKYDIETEDLTSSPIEVNLSISLNYTQADNNAKTNDNQFVYTASDTSQFVGSALPSITTYSTSASAISAFGAPVFVKHKISNGLIEKSFIGIKKDSNIIYYKTDTDGSNFYRNKYLANIFFDMNDYSNFFELDESYVAYYYYGAELPYYGTSIGINSANELYYGDENGVYYICEFINDGSSDCFVWSE